MRRSRPLAAALLLALALLVAACADDDDGDATDRSVLAVQTATCGEVEFGGEGTPDALIVSDLPMRGDSAVRSKQQVEAIRLVLEQASWRAGSTTVGYQACDDTLARTGLWDPATCRANARAYAGQARLLGVVGTYNSGCAAEMIPILGRAGVAMVSPGNTAVCLTQPSASCEDYSPRTLYRGGRRTYARVVPNDAFQGAALATYVKDRGLGDVVVLSAAGDPTSAGQAANFIGAARRAGVRIADQMTWDPKATTYTAVLRRAKRPRPKAIVLAGLTEQHGARVIRDKVTIVGSNADVPLIAFDGFAQQSTIDQAGAAARGMVASVPGQAPERLTGQGAAFVRALRSRLDADHVELYAPYAGEAAQVLLGAIAKAGVSRPRTVDAMFSTRRAGILGAYRFTASGDPSVGPVTLFTAGAAFAPRTVVSPAAALVRAARDGRAGAS